MRKERRGRREDRSEEDCKGIRERIGRRKRNG